MPPPSVTVRRARGAPVIDSGTDFRMAIIGTSSLNPLAVGALSAPYGSPDALAGDYGLGDGVDAAFHALKAQDDNPSPSAISFLSTLGLSSTTLGVRGTVTTSGVTGTAVPTATAGTHPLGTYEPRVRVVDDGNNGAGTAIGTTGIILQGSVDNGRTWLPTSALLTATTWKLQIPNPGGAPFDTGAQYDLDTPSLSALYTALNALRTAVIAHFIIVSGSPAVHAAADTTDNAALTAIAAATTPATAVTLFNGIKTLLATHVASALYHTVADTAAEAAIAAVPTAVNVEDVELGLAALTAAYNAHRILVGSGPVHGSPDSTNTVSPFVAVPGTLKTGDIWYESKTTPPQWAVADLFTSGSPGSGALMTIAAASLNFGLVVITEPVQASDIATLSAGLDAMKALRSSCRPTLVVRFRNQAAGESDATYTAAFETFRAACADDARIVVWANDGWLTDAMRSYVYSRSGLPSFLAKIQGNNVLAGPKGERVAQSPTLTKRGGGPAPLVGFTIHDTNGNPVGHDERVHPGILGPLSGKGGGACAYYEGADGIAGTYCAGADTLYGIGSTVLNIMDSRVSSGLERTLYQVAFLALGGADIVTSGVLDDDSRESMSNASTKAIRDAGYENEFANAGDPNLVAVDPNVVVLSPGNLQVTWNVNDELYSYTNAIVVTVANGRG